MLIAVICAPRLRRRALGALLVGLALFAGSAPAFADQFYFTRTRANDDAERSATGLFLWDDATGAQSQIGGDGSYLRHATDGPISVDGIATDLSGTLYGFAIDDATTGAFLPLDTAAYCSTNIRSRLVSINTSTGEFTYVGNWLSGRHIVGAAFDGLGRLWSIDCVSGDVVQISPATGAVVGGPIATGMATIAADLDFAANGMGIIGFSGLQFRVFDPNAGWVAETPISAVNNGFDGTLTPPYAITGIAFTSNLSARNGSPQADACRLNLFEGRGTDELGHVNDPFFADPAVAYKEADQYNPPAPAPNYNGGPGDGARAGGPALPECFYDYGDAPDSYGTERASNGAQHAIVAGGPYLGAGQPDFEVDGQPNATATGDDVTGTGDEDGVTIPAELNRGSLVQIDVNVGGLSAGTRLQAWIDWGGDGSFAEAGDQILIDQAVSAGLNTFDIIVPVNATPGTTFARFRIADETGLGATGPASSGEVEDYQVTISADQPNFVCDSSMYLSMHPGGAAEGTTIVRVDSSTNPFGFDDVVGKDSRVYNGIGFDPITGYMYAPYWDPDDGTTGIHHLLRIGSDGSVQDMGRIIGGGINQDEARGAFATGVVGTDGFLYVKHNTGAGSEFFRINLSDRSAVRIGLTFNGNPIAIPSADWAWHNGLLYSHDYVNDRLYTVDPGTGVVNIIGTSGVPTAVFGSMISATNGIFGRDNNGGFYQFDPATGEATLISSSPTGPGDGAKCPSTAVTLPADTQIVKDDFSDSYEPGGEVVYTIIVSNNGPFGVQNALVTDLLPDGITEATWSCGTPVNGGTCGVEDGTGDIVSVPVNLPVNGSVTFELTMTVPADFTGELTNTATVVNPDDVPDPDTANNEDDDTDVSLPLLTLEKSVVTDDGGTAVPTDFTLTADGPTPVSGISGQPEVTAVPVEPGTYTLGEEEFPGYTASPYLCALNGGTPVEGNSLALALGDSAVCTITNDDEPATLTLAKTIVNNDGGIAEAVDFTLSATGPVSLSGPTGDPSVTDVAVPAGTYTLSETGPAGYTAGTYRCAIDGAAPLVSNTLDLDSGQDAVCTITNDDIPPDVTRLKELVGESIAVDRFPQDGELLTYEITLTNTGGTASDYPLVDVLDDNVTFVSASHGGTLSGNAVEWTLTVPAQDGAAPGELVLTVVTQVIDPLPPGEEVVNYVSGSIVDPPPPCPSAECVVIPPPPFVEDRKDLVAESGSVTGVAEPGERLTYEITLSNLGSTTSAYDHRDLLDENMVLVSADNGGVHTGGSPGGGQVDWTDLTVPGGTPSAPGTLVLTVVVDVVDPLPDGVSQIVNLSYDPTQPPPVCPSVRCVVLPVPGIVHKDKQLVGESIAVDGVAEPGEQLTYEITLTNTGGPVTDYAVEDRMDPNTFFISATDGGTESGGTVTWSGLAIDAHDGTNPGVLVLTVTVEVEEPLPAGVVQLTNIVAEPGEVVDCEETPQQCVTTPTAPQISKLKQLVGESGGTLSSVAEPGEILTYRITVTNQGGPDTAYEVQDLLDPNTTFTGADNGGQLMGDHVAWTLAVPAHDGTNPGQRVVEVTVRVDDPLPDGVTQLVNIAREPGEIIDCNVTPTPPECVITQTGPKVSRLKQLVGESIAVDGVAEPGEELTYEITLTNTGGAEHPGYDLVDDYDTNVEVVNAGGGTDNGDVINWSGLVVPPQVGDTPGTLVLTVVVRVDDPLPAGVTEVANVIHEPGEVVDCTETPDSCVTVPAAPQISSLKRLVDESGTTTDVAEPGETLTYEITLTNRGGPATDYPTYDFLDANTAFASADNGGVHDGSVSGGVVEWTGLAVPAQSGDVPGTLVLTVSVTVNDPLPEGTLEIVNIIKEDPTGPDPECPSDQCVVIDAQQPELILSKVGAYEDTDGNGLSNPGDRIRYTFTVRNMGNVSLADVVPEDSGPTFNGQPAENSLSAFTPSSVTLQPDEEREFTATYTLGRTDIDNGAGVEDGVENTATAVGYANGSRVTGTPVESGESAWVLALPFAASDVTITKVALLRHIRRGEQAPFVIRVTNNVGSRTDNVIVTDTMPSGFRYVEGSATVDGVAVEPVVEGRNLHFGGLALEGNGEVEIRLRLLALSSAGPGEHVNRANVTDENGNPLAREARAVVEILAEHVFDCGDIVGKVFDDLNRNGYQDQGEPGLPGVRIATVKGWLITTDAHGRFHVACADLPDQRIGSNFIMKVDPRTLPSGYRLTSENPRVVRLTAGKLTKLNFGASIGRVVRLDVKDEAFLPGETDLRPEWSAGIDQLIAVLSQERSVLRLAYLDAATAPELAGERVRQMKELIAERWRQRRGRYPLDIETRVEAGQ